MFRTFFAGVYRVLGLGLVDDDNFCDAMDDDDDDDDDGVDDGDDSDVVIISLDGPARPRARNGCRRE